MDMMKYMKKSDLKDGVILETNGGGTYQVYISLEKALGVLGCESVIPMSIWEDDLTCPQNYYFDVVAVYLPTDDTNEELNSCECIWRRDEQKTLEERITAIEEHIKSITKNFVNVKGDVEAAINAIMVTLGEIRVALDNIE